MRIKILPLVCLATLFLSSCKDSSQEQNISVGEIIEIESTILGETREIYIYQPEGFWGMDENMSDLPVIYVLDGESQFLHTASTVDFLSSAPYGNDKIPRSIVVGIPNTEGNRNRDLSPIKGIIANDPATLETTGGGPKFLNFISEELIPYIDKNYKTSQHRTLIGHSLGGLLTFEALLRKRELFDNYIAIDPALGYAEEAYMNEIIDTLQNSNLLQENIFISASNTRPTFLTRQDLKSDTSGIMKLIDIPNQKFLSAADTSQWQINLTTKYYEDENHYSVPHRSTSDGIKALYDYYTFPEITNYYHPKYKDRKDLVESIKEHYKMISTKMGYEVMPMEGYLNSFAFGIAPSGRTDLAIDLFEYNIELHPNNPIVYNGLGYFYMNNGNKEKAIEIYNQSLLLESDDWVSDTVERLEKEVTEENK